MATSPFPGMDPFLEDVWPEVHASLIVYARNQINDQLPGDLRAKIERTLSVFANDAADRSVRPDVHVSEVSEFGSFQSAQSGVAVADPVVVTRDPGRYRHVEIADSSGRVITAIEFLSPWNKVGKRGQQQYTRKQLEFMEAGVNLVEIDLVRQGDYVLAPPLADIPEDRRTPYMICVYRDITPDQYAIYPVKLQEPLPNIAIPLRPDDRDVVLQLQPLIDACYHDGRYSRSVYERELSGRFDAADAAWLTARLREAGHRQ
ncbi:MAG: DUF4058 family protein [Planctomycetaceae bacterium]